MRVVALISGGKDSCFNMMHCRAMGHEIVALANLQPKVDGEADSFMYQSVGHEAISLYAEAMQLPLYRRTIQGTSKLTTMNYTPVNDDEVEDLFELLKSIKEEIEFDAVSCGAILSDYQRIRVEGVCSRLNLHSLTYLWRQDQTKILLDMIKSGVDAILIKVAALGLDQQHLGKSLAAMQHHLFELNSKYGCHVCGEGGEYETFTLDCPLFKKCIVIDDQEIVIHSDDGFAPVSYLRLKFFHLEEKAKTIFDFSQLVPKFCNDTSKEENTNINNLKKKSAEEADLSFSTEFHQTHMPSVTINGPICTISVIIGCLDMQELSENNIKDCMKNALTKTMGILESKGHNMKDLCYIHLYVANMEHFQMINSVYKTFFNQNPPARVCVGLQLSNSKDSKSNVLMSIDCVSWKPEKTKNKVMHVQGISHWAPANIGPYSQCVQRGNTFFVAGQIGLVPGSMELVEGGICAQGSLSLKHVKSVLTAMDAKLDYKDIAQCVCYVTDENHIKPASSIWDKTVSKDCILYVVVPSLPKQALIEWQVIAVKQDNDLNILEDSNENDRIQLKFIMKDRSKLVTDLQNTLQGLFQDITEEIKSYENIGLHALQIRLYYALDGISLDTMIGLCKSLTNVAVACVPVNSIFVHNSENSVILSAFCVMHSIS
uniref:Diphthine--ammonia ligase n=1 Tax=Phallusia mammillata TaxID=59560 RepID=A0A6F9DBW3_9ASCI|nr:diphthine--ammonia ligase [Phallusia mammillata]